MKSIFFLILALFVLNVSSQEVLINNNNDLLPTSIYSTSYNKLLLINKKLDKPTLEYATLNVDTAQKGLFSISAKDIKRSSKFFNETYQEKALNKAITSAFFDLDALYNLPRVNPKD